MNNLKFVLFLMAYIVPMLACGQSKAPTAKVKHISQFERVGYSDLLIDKNNVYHVVFQESPDYGKPTFVYYSKSTDAGLTWSKPFTLSNDDTGNGAGHPRLIADKSGAIYAIWKRYGLNGAKYPQPDAMLDGKGGNTQGTIFYKLLSNGSWSNQFQVSDSEGSQFSWFPALHPNGKVVMMWSEVSPESLKNKWLMWYYADWIRTATLTPTGAVERATYSQPSPPEYKGGAPKQLGAFNLDGYIAADGIVRMIFERIEDKQQVLWYFDGKKYEIVYRYPMYKAGNTFMNPPSILYDEKGVDHIILRPSSSVLESEQVWDIIPAQQKKNVIAEITKKGFSIQGIQASQGPNGKMAVCIEVGTVSSASEAVGIFYDAGKWNVLGITKNAAKENFLYKEFNTIATRTYLSTLTRYSTTHSSIAYDKMGKPQMTMTLSADWIAGGYRVNSPSLTFVKLN